MALARHVLASGLGLITCLWAGTASGEGGPIRGGSHDGFTRIVLTVDPTTEWSMETVEGAGAGAHALLSFPGRRLAFDTRPVFERIDRSRVANVRYAYDGSGTTVRLDIACDCSVSTALVGGRYLAVDVIDAGQPTRVETLAQRTAREVEAVADAEQALIRQIRRAAGQGLVELTDGATPSDVTPEHRKLVTAPDEAADEPGQRDHKLGSGRLEMLGHDQIEAKTVFDRDARRVAETRATKSPEVCVSDQRLDIDAWSNGMTAAVQIGALRNGLVGEFDLPSPANIESLSRLYIRFGLGAEAEALLAAFPDASIEERQLLIDLSRAVDGRPQKPESLLATAEACRGPHGFWLALVGEEIAAHDAGWFETVLAAFAELPPDLRRLLAPTLVRRLIDAGRLVEARKVQDTADRSGAAPTAEQEVAGAELLAAENSPSDAVRILTRIALSADPVSLDALTSLIRIALDADISLPEALVLELEAAALEMRGSETEFRIRSLLAEARAQRGEILDALYEIRSATADLPGTTNHFSALASRLLAEADPERTGGAAYAEAALRYATLITDPSSRTRIAEHLVEIGLPAPASALLADFEPNARTRLVAAMAELRLNRPEAARTLLADRRDPAAADLRARTFAQELAFGEALAALPDSSDLAADYAWAAGDWDTTLTTNAADPVAPHAVMAEYMRSRGTAEDERRLEVILGSSELKPEAAFLAPLPPLNRPSLMAARQLTRTSPTIGDYITNFLQPPAGNLAISPSASRLLKKSSP